MHPPWLGLFTAHITIPKLSAYKFSDLHTQRVSLRYLCGVHSVHTYVLSTVALTHWEVCAVPLPGPCPTRCVLLGVVSSPSGCAVHEFGGGVQTRGGGGDDEAAGGRGGQVSAPSRNPKKNPKNRPTKKPSKKTSKKKIKK